MAWSDLLDPIIPTEFNTEVPFEAYFPATSRILIHYHFYRYPRVYISSAKVTSAILSCYSFMLRGTIL